MTTWVLVANAAEAKLYSSSNLRTDDLHLFKEYNHPDSRKKVSDLVSDKPGHYDTDIGRGAFEKGNPKKAEAEHFALELIKELKTHCVPNEVKSLIIVVPDSFYKFMIKHFDFNVYNNGKFIHIAKDYTKYTLKELMQTLKEQLL